ncbi:hypothetical protein [Halococcus salifodinae]|uniref:hypothetical protein n=1 Tax=Halococcus salifodinae TaxID=36738 RepID=UPI00126902EC|nr:hypothetical protein [Halococcus salifodinae]
MTSPTEVAEGLRDLNGDDGVTLVLRGGAELVGTVVDNPEYVPPTTVAKKQVQIPGGLLVRVNLNSESWSNLPSRHVSAHVEERSPGQWYDAKASVWRPIYADESNSAIVDDEFESIGEIVEVRVGDGS